MIILPAIDIKDGNCVRLFKGDFSTVEKVAADYMETAKGFEAAGASWIHMVDLDGAKEGRPVNRHIYEDVAAKTDLKVEVGGGIRNLETIDTYLKSGVERVILGSAALKNPQLVKNAVQKFGSQHIAVGIDAKNGMVATEGWLEESDTDYIREAAEQVSVFMINAKVSGDNIYCTYADDFQATYEVTKAFIRRGKEKILFMYDSESYSARQKMAGYEAALQDAGYPIRGNLKFKTKNDIEYTRDMLLEYNRTLDFDSVLATEDGIAIGAVKYAKIKGLAIPEELAVVGYNNSILAISSDPELTSVDSKLGVMCKKTVERMIDLLEREIRIEKNVCVPCEIVRRCTTDF